MRWRYFVLGLGFVLTGASGLVVEQVFEKLLSTVVGASTPAGAIVLAVYFLGLCVGALLYPRLRRRVPNGAVLYAAVEAFTGLWGLLLAAFLSPVQELSGHLVALGGDHGAAVFALRLLVALAWIAPPTVAMGASFPGVVAYLRHTRDRARTGASAFYALNVAGAVVGSFGAAYGLFPWLGLRGGLAVTGAAQLLVAAVVASAFRGERHEEAPLAPGAIVQALRAREHRAALAASALSGFVVFSAEVLWLHLAGLTVGMSAYTFASVVTFVLIGLALGGALAARAWRGSDTVPAEALPVTLVVACAGLAVVMPFWPDVPIFLIHRHDWADGFVRGELARGACLVALVGLPSTFLGLVYPTVIRLPGQAAPDAMVSALAVANAVGSVLGSLLTGFALVGALGIEGIYRGLLVVLSLGAVALGRALSLDRRGWVAVAGAASVAVAGALWAPAWSRLALSAGAHVYFENEWAMRGAQVTFWTEDPAGGVTSVVDFDGQRTLLTNGKFQGNDTGEMTEQVALSLVPCLLTSARRLALQIGLGTGQGLRTLRDCGFERLEVAELSPGMIAAAPHFSGLNRDVLRDPVVRVAVEDGRNHVLRSRERYDVVCIEISSIWFAGASSLYTEEFYRQVAGHLAEDGVLQQWIQLHHIAIDELEIALSTVRAVFPHVSLWLVGDQGIIIASHGPLSPDVTRLQRPELEPDLKVLGGRLSLEELPRRVLLDDDAITRLAQRAAARGLPLQTDGNRALEYSTPRHNLERIDHWAVNVRALGTFIEPAEVREARLATYLDPPSR